MSRRLKQFIILGISLLIFACQNKETSSVKTDIVIQLNKDSDNIENHDFECNCKTANQIFNFKNGKKIALCGEPDEEKLYSEFIILECNKDSILEDWSNDATVSSKIHFKNDTLIIEEICGIPNGKNKVVQQLPFFIDKYYFF